MMQLAGMYVKGVRFGRVYKVGFGYSLFVVVCYLWLQDVSVFLIEDICYWNFYSVIACPVGECPLSNTLEYLRQRDISDISQLQRAKVNNQCVHIAP